MQMKEVIDPACRMHIYEGSNRPCLQNAYLRRKKQTLLAECISTKEVIDPACRMQIYEGSNRPCLQNADIRSNDPACRMHIYEGSQTLLAECRSTKEVIDPACRMQIYEGSNRPCLQNADILRRK